MMIIISLSVSLSIPFLAAVEFCAKILRSDVNDIINKSKNVDTRLSYDFPPALIDLRDRIISNPDEITNISFQLTNSITNPDDSYMDTHAIINTPSAQLFINLQQKIIMFRNKLTVAELVAFDERWKLVLEQRELTVEVISDIKSDIILTNKKMRNIININNGASIIFLFVRDLLVPKSIKAEIFMSKVDEEFRNNSNNATLTDKLFSFALICILGILSMWGITLLNIQFNNNIQNSFLVCYAFQFVFEIFIYSPFSCIFNDFLISSFIYNNLRDVRNILKESTHNLPSKKHSPELNSASYFFVSHGIALMHSNLIGNNLIVSNFCSFDFYLLPESLVVLCYSSTFPSSIFETPLGFCHFSFQYICESSFIHFCVSHYVIRKYCVRFVEPLLLLGLYLCSAFSSYYFCFGCGIIIASCYLCSVITSKKNNAVSVYPSEFNNDKIMLSPDDTTVVGMIDVNFPKDVENIDINTHGADCEDIVVDGNRMIAILEIAHNDDRFQREQRDHAIGYCEQQYVLDQHINSYVYISDSDENDDNDIEDNEDA